VYQTAEDVPLRQLMKAGAQIALGADDPLLFGSRLTAQYESARTVHGLSDVELAELARASVRGSRAPSLSRAQILADIDTWLVS
jgi:adenosine deaminase